MITVTAPPRGNGMSHSSQPEGPPPCESPCIQPDPASGEGSPAASPVKVLIVEDSPIVGERLAALIEGVENTVIVGQARDGFQAQQLFRQHRPDAVVLDIQLPGIDGFELLAQFKKEHPACVVMIVTTYAFKAFRQRCAALGADHFFDKTTEFEQITGVLGALRTQRGLESGNSTKPER